MCKYIFHSALLLVFTGITSFAYAEELAQPDDILLARLLSGEIVVSDTRTDEAGGSARVLFFLPSDPGPIWDVIASCDQAPLFVGGLKHCETLQDDGTRAVVHQIVKKAWYVPAQDFTFESLREQHKAIRFRLIDGNLRVLEGRWLFEERDGGTLVDYLIRVQPGMPVPRWLIRRSIRKDMPDTVACIRGLSEASGSVEQMESDLARCPGALPG